MTALVLTLALALGASRAVADEAPPAPVTVKARVEPDTTTIGGRVRYTMEITTPPDAELMLTQPTERLGDFDIVDFGDEPQVTRDGKTTVTRWFTLVGWEPGEHWVDSPPVRYRLPGEEIAEAPGAGLRISVESVLAKTPGAADLRDVKPIEQVPIDWRPWWILGGGVVALAGLAFLLYRLANRPRGAASGPPPRPAEDVARDALEALRRRRLVETGAFKEYYSALSDIVRTYLEQRFKVRAPEMTTEEFLLSTARDGRLQASHRALLGQFLGESDLVKFARHHPTIGDTERAWTAARRFVDETGTSPGEGLRAAG